MVNHKMADIPKASALIPAYAQGDTADRPKPVPNIVRISAKAAAAVAPAIIEPHDTALAWAGRASVWALGEIRV
jgi:hypothetical protein